MTIALLSLISQSVSANNLKMVQDMTKTLEEVKHGPQVLEDCPEAKEHEKLVKACEEVGHKKVQAEAKHIGIYIQESMIKVCEVDARIFSLADYVWFCADTPKGRISKMVQKPLFKECF